MLCGLWLRRMAGDCQGQAAVTTSLLMAMGGSCHCPSFRVWFPFSGRCSCYPLASPVFHRRLPLPASPSTRYMSARFPLHVTCCSQGSHESVSLRCAGYQAYAVETPFHCEFVCPALYAGEALSCCVPPCCALALFTPCVRLCSSCLALACCRYLPAHKPWVLAGWTHCVEIATGLEYSLNSRGPLPFRSACCSLLRCVPAWCALAPRVRACDPIFCCASLTQAVRCWCCAGNGATDGNVTPQPIGAFLPQLVPRRAVPSSACGGDATVRCPTACSPCPRPSGLLLSIPECDTALQGVCCGTRMAPRASDP